MKPHHLPACRQVGRHIFGLAAIAFGSIGLFWHDFNSWQQIVVFGNVPHREILEYIIAVVEILGGIAIQWQKTLQVGAFMIGVIYLIFVLLWLPSIVSAPLVYDHWGNFFEQLSLVSGALIAYSSASSGNSERIARIGYIFFGICVISFTLEQLFYLSGTASFVPKWIPPSQKFWAITTTIAFALAAIAILSGRLALLASRLLTAMIIGFGVFVWLPILFTDFHKLFNWAGNAENLAIAGASWIVVDYLNKN